MAVNVIVLPPVGVVWRGSGRCSAARASGYDHRCCGRVTGPKLAVTSEEHALGTDGAAVISPLSYQSRHRSGWMITRLNCVQKITSHVEPNVGPFFTGRCLTI